MGGQPYESWLEAAGARDDDDADDPDETLVECIMRVPRSTRGTLLASA